MLRIIGYLFLYFQIIITFVLMILYYPLIYKELYGTYSKLFKEDWEN